MTEGMDLLDIGKPGTETAAIDLAIRYYQAGQLGEAETLCQRLLQQHPDNTTYLQILGAIACQSGQTEISLTYFRRAAILEPRNAKIQSNLGFALKQQGKTTEAIACYRQAITLNPNYAQAHHNLAALLHTLGQFQESIVHARKAIALQPDFAEAHFGLANTLLLTGDLLQGFAEYEWRWHTQGFSRRQGLQPLWDGDRLNGQTLLIDTEQGFGDTIQFIRYAKVVAERGGRAIVRCAAPLQRLLTQMPAIAQAIPFTEAVPEFQVHAPLMSLPYLLKTTLETIPVPVPYLYPPSTIHLPRHPDTRLTVGVVWSSQSQHPTSGERSCPLELFLRLLEIPGVQLYSLQKDLPAGDREKLNASPIQDLSDRCNDFADTATFISSLDLIITVDTAVAHLAGALGKPTWVLLPYLPDWRWMWQRPDSPWYPTLQLFRQQQPGCWESIFPTVQTTLKTLAGDRNIENHQTVMNYPLPLPKPTLKKLGISWSIGITSGWEVYGLNLTLQLLKNCDCEPLLLTPPSLKARFLNPLHEFLLHPIFEKQKNFYRLFQENPHQNIRCHFPILYALGNNLVTSGFPNTITSDRKIGIIFFENVQFTQDALEQAKTYERIVAGSHWNAEVLKSYGLTNVIAVHQGIDPALFHPAPKSKLFGDRFVIFSGGKLEYRKGQDIIIAAFKQFHQRHPEALLITAWHTFFPQFMVGLETTGNVVGLPKINAKGQLEIAEWLLANGLPSDSFINIGITPHYLTGQILREADVAIFTNRCEGGTNLVAMESMACGIPTLLSANTGHLDLIESDNCYPLYTQSRVSPTSQFNCTEGWGESDLEEVLATLETIYTHPTTARNRGLKAATFMQNWTWQKQISQLHQTLS